MVELFMCHVDLAMRTANSRRRQLVLLGIKPDRAESGYGWMELAGSLCEGSTLLRVTRFWEKRPEPVVRRLWQRGCLWNSFVMAGTARALITMIYRALPELKATVARMWPAIETPDEDQAMKVAYADLPCRDFAGDVLAHDTSDLANVPVEGLYWNDLGDSRQVYETLARMQLRTGWMTQEPNTNHSIAEGAPPDSSDELPLNTDDPRRTCYWAARLAEMTPIGWVDVSGHHLLTPSPTRVSLTRWV
jgi:mannose-1-phosphate guanylyltransferase